MSAKGERSLAGIAERLRVSREALGLSQAKFCRMAGLHKQTYNAYELAKERPSIDMAFKIKDTHRLTLEWIYDADHSGLRAQLFDAIRALRKTRNPS